MANQQQIDFIQRITSSVQKQQEISKQLYDLVEIYEDNNLLSGLSNKDLETAGYGYLTLQILSDTINSIKLEKAFLYSEGHNQTYNKTRRL